MPALKPANPTDPAPRDGSGRIGAFLDKDREGGTHPAVASLHARPRGREPENRKAVEYARIERGRTV